MDYTDLDSTILKNELDINLSIDSIDIFQCKFDLFKLTVEKIREKKEEAVNIQKVFERVMNKEELGECFHFIIEADLQGLKTINLSLKTCNEKKAKKLEEIGFNVTEIRNTSNDLCAYRIYWD